MPRESPKPKLEKLGGILRLRKKFKNPKRLLFQVGAILLAQAQQSFQRQALGDFLWKVRYPNQTEDHVNVAGAVADLSKSGNIKKRRFTSTPALRDTGTLLRSLNDRSRSIRPKGTNVIEVGTTLSYAARHQWGGTSEQPVTSVVKERLGKFLKKKKNKRFRKHLGFLFQIDTLETSINQRPFLGFTNISSDRITELVQDDLQSELERR